ncbi:MAG: adenylosuccinate synthetase [bacterium]|nr:adenylosuccinate synthetase [bacterium]
MTKYEDLPLEAKRYLKEIEKQTEAKISYVSTGGDRKEIIKL